MISDYKSRTSLLDTYRPAIVRLADNLIAACFPLMKIYPAHACLEQAAARGVIDPDTLIVESSSGTMALGLAIACRWSGYKLAIVSDAACDPLVTMRLKDLGADVTIVPAPLAVGGYQRARLNKVDEICRLVPNSWWVNQYDNVDNAQSYSAFAADLVESLGRIDCIVGTVGSGGSVCGTANYLRMLFPHLYVVGVDTLGSVLFGQPDEHRTLRGLGNSLLPQNLDHTVFNEVHWVTAAEAYTATRMLHRDTALFRGGTSGACWLVARRWAELHPDQRTVCLFPDDGYRYLQSIYDDAYMSQNNLWIEFFPEPGPVEHPLDAGPKWSYINWARRGYEAVTGLNAGNGQVLSAA